MIHARVSSVVDGDTIKVRAYRPRRRSYTVRLIGIDTPETRRPGTPVECGGPEASANMKRLARPRARVTLTTDPTQDTFDRYDRLLAYVETRSGRQLNVAQVADGWAEVYVFDDDPFQQVSRFRAAERRARNAGRGVWGQCGGDFHRPDAQARGAQAVGVPESYGARFLRRFLRRHGYRAPDASCHWTDQQPGRERWACSWEARKRRSTCAGNARVSNFFTPPESFRQSVRLTRKRCRRS